MRRVTATRLLVAAAVGVALFRIALCLWLGFRTRVFYDEGGDFAQAALLARGKVLYRDAVAAHPPLSFLVYAPFTWVGPPSFAIGVCRLVSGVMGGVTAWFLGDTVRRRFGIGPALATIAVYLVLPEVAQAERSVLVEATLNLVAAAAVHAWFVGGRDGAGSPRRAGIFWGAALLTKVWGVFLAPAFVVSALLGGRARRLPQLGRVAVVTVAAGMTPVLSLAARPYFEQVLSYQLTRNQTGTRISDRASLIFGWGDAVGAARAWPSTIVIVAGLVVLLAGRRRDDVLTFGLVWFATIAAAFLAAGAYHVQYNAHLGPAVALVAGAVAHRLPAVAVVAPRWRFGAVALAAVAAVIVGALVVPSLRHPEADPTAAVAAVVRRTSGCLWADSPGWLVVGDRLPDVERFGPIASEPVGGLLSLPSGSGAVDSAQRKRSMDRERRRLLGVCPRLLRLPEEAARSDDLAGHVVVASTGPGGPELWVERSVADR